MLTQAQAATIITGAGKQYVRRFGEIQDQRSRCHEPGNWVPQGYWGVSEKGAIGTGNLKSCVGLIVKPLGSSRTYLGHCDGFLRFDSIASSLMSAFPLKTYAERPLLVTYIGGSNPSMRTVAAIDVQIEKLREIGYQIPEPKRLIAPNQTHTEFSCCPATQEILWNPTRRAKSQYQTEVAQIELNRHCYLSLFVTMRNMLKVHNSEFTRDLEKYDDISMVSLIYREFEQLNPDITEEHASDEVGRRVQERWQDQIDARHYKVITRLVNMLDKALESNQKESDTEEDLLGSISLLNLSE